MKQIVLIIALFYSTANVFSQTNSVTKKEIKMKLNAGILTEKLAETKEFYTKTLNFGVTFEN